MHDMDGSYYILALPYLLTVRYLYELITEIPMFGAGADGVVFQIE